MKMKAKTKKMKNPTKPMSRGKFFALSILFTFIFSVVIIAGYFIYSVNFRGMVITNVKAIQDNYAKYMVEKNDEFIDYMLEFEEMMSTPQRMYSEEEVSELSKNLVKQNALMKTLQKNPPNTENKDYLEIYKDYLKLYAFYIQGEVMRVEYVSAYKPEYTLEEIQNGTDAKDETYIMGVELCNMMGALILENSILVNEIRGTNYNSKFDIIPLDEWRAEVEEKRAAYEALNESSSVENVIENYQSITANNGGKTQYGSSDDK